MDSAIGTGASRLTYSTKLTQAPQRAIMADKMDSYVSGLANIATGLGTASDKATQGQWMFREPDPVSLENAVRSNWMASKIVDIPALDMMREGWEWQSDEADVESIEALCDELDVCAKVIKALKLARLFGGAGVYMSDGGADPSEPLDVDSIGKGGLKYLTVFTRYQITSDRLQNDPTKPNYGEPELYRLTGEGASVLIHPSRVVRFIGKEIPTAHAVMTDRWGDSVLTAVDQTIRDCTAGQQGIATLIQESSVDVFKYENFMNLISTKEGEAKLLKRQSLVQLSKSINRSVAMDTKDEWEQKTVSFAGLTDIQNLLLQIVSGAADIPATRMIGQAPQGMNATGDSDMRNYYDRISGEQELTLRPCLDKLFAVIVRSALGSYPAGLKYKFRPLWQLSEKDAAEVNNKNAQTAKLYDEAGLVDPDVLRLGVKSQLIEGDVYPGIAKAYKDVDAIPAAPDARAGLEPDGDNNVVPLRRAVSDAAPRTLYLSRDVVNANDIAGWAKSQGINPIAADEMHVTVIYSRRAVDWMEAGEDWNYSEDAPNLTIKSGGPRIVEPLGDRGAVVLHFACDDIVWRHEDIRRKTGASHDFASYQPHITITYDGAGLDLTDIEPYQGEIVLGPEKFAELDLNWKPAQ